MTASAPQPEILPAATRRPQQRAPQRPHGSIRRSSHIGVRWPSVDADVATSDLLVHGAVRDVRTDEQGCGSIVGDAVLDCVLSADRIVTELSTDPSEAGLQTLVGHVARSGWRAKARAVLGAESILATVLDDVPIAVLLSSYGALRHGTIDVTAVRPLMMHMRNLCAGWSQDATPMRRMDAGGPMPLPGVVPAPGEPEADALGTERRAPMVPGEMRRLRRLDVTPGDSAVVHASFRDVWCDAAGDEGVLHEYVLTATIERDVITTIEAEPRVLPYDECSFAARSPQRLVGTRVDAVAESVRAGAGQTTCTHLDDLLRSLDVVPALLRAASSGDDGRTDW